MSEQPSIPPPTVERLTRRLIQHVAGGGAVVLAIVVWIIRSSSEALAPTGGVNHLWTAVVVLAVVASAWQWGRLFLSLAVLSGGLPASLPAVLVAGTFVESLILLVGRFVLPVPMSLLFVLQFGVAMSVWWLTRGAAPRMPNSALQALGPTPLLATLISLLAATFWVQHYFPAVQGDGAELVFPLVRDYYFYAEQAELLASPATPFETGRVGLAGHPVPLYHYASFSLPAAVASLTGLSTYELMIGVWLPLGIALAGMTAWILGNAWFGPVRGLWCMAAVICLPDPTILAGAYDTPSSVFYSFDRFLQYAPANWYALAFLGLALAIATHRGRPIASGWLGVLVLLGGSMMFKAQLFMAAVPLTAIWLVALAWVHRAPIIGAIRAYPRRIAGVTLVVLFMGLASIPLFRERVPRIALEWPMGERISEFIVTITREEPLSHRFAIKAADSHGVSAGLLRAALVLWLPMRLVLLPLLLVGLSRTRRRPDMSDAAVFCVITIYIAFAIGLAPNFTSHTFGHPWDLLQVPFTWMMFVTMVWLAGRLIPAAIEEHQGWGDVTAILLVGPLVVGSIPFDDYLADIEWSHQHVETDLVHACVHLRDFAGRLDRVQSSDDDPYYLVEAISERRPFVGWSVVATYTAETTVDEIVQDRRQQHRLLRESTSREEIARQLDEMGIDWYLLHPESGVAWPAEVVAHPTKEWGAYRLYRTDAIRHGPNR